MQVCVHQLLSDVLQVRISCSAMQCFTVNSTTAITTTTITAGKVVQAVVNAMGMGNFQPTTARKPHNGFWRNFKLITIARGPPTTLNGISIQRRRWSWRIGSLRSILRGWSKYAPNKSKMADGRHFEKKTLNHDISTTFWSILMKSGTVGPYSWPTIKISYFLKSKMAVVATLENRKITVSQQWLDLHKIWHYDA